MFTYAVYHFYMYIYGIYIYIPLIYTPILREGDISQPTNRSLGVIFDADSEKKGDSQRPKRSP